MSKLLNVELEFDKFLQAVGWSDMEKGSMEYEQAKRIFSSGMMCMFGKLAFELPELEDEEANEELQAIFTEIKNS